MRWPPPGGQRSSFQEYLHGPRRGATFACLAGLVCGIGNAAQFLGGAWAGFAAADLVQAFPLVGTLWGVCLFGEFRRASGRVYGLLAAMFGCFITAVVMLVLSVR